MVLKALIVEPGCLVGESAQPPRIWRIVSGVVELVRAPAGEAPRFAGLACPGDLIGLDLVFAGQSTLLARALTQCSLSESEDLQHPWDALFWMRACAAEQTRTTQAVALRTGPVTERVRQLLLLVSHAHSPSAVGTRDHEVPKLRDMARIVDSAPETVSRVLSHLRRSDILHHRQICEARFDPRQLRECRFPRGVTHS